MDENTALKRSTFRKIAAPPLAPAQTQRAFLLFSHLIPSGFDDSKNLSGFLESRLERDSIPPQGGAKGHETLSRRRTKFFDSGAHGDWTRSVTGTPSISQPWHHSGGERIVASARTLLQEDSLEFFERSPIVHQNQEDVKSDRILQRLGSVILMEQRSRAVYLVPPPSTTGTSRS